MAKAKSEKTKANVPDRADREMFSAICSNCGKECQVPFRPVGDKPVYCPECFQKIRAAKGQQNNRPQNNQQNNNQHNHQNHNHNGNHQNHNHQYQNQQNQQQGNIPSNQDLLNRINSLNSKIERIIDFMGINQLVKEQPIQHPAKAEKPEVAVAVEEKPAKKSKTSTAAKPTTTKKASAKKPVAKKTTKKATK